MIISNKLLLEFDRFSIIENKYKELREAAESALRRLDLYENMIGINSLSNEEINSIEN